MSEQKFHAGIRLRSPETSFGSKRPSERPVLLKQPGTARVREERLAVVAESDLLAEPAAVDGWITHHACALPATDQERQRAQVRMRRQVPAFRAVRAFRAQPRRERRARTLLRLHRRQASANSLCPVVRCRADAAARRRAHAYGGTGSA